MSQEKELRIDVDASALSRCCQPSPTDFNGAWLTESSGPGSRVPIRCAADGTIVGEPYLGQRCELARFGLLELVADVVVNVSTVGDPRVAEG